MATIYTCEICDKEFKQKIHYINHKNKKNKCSLDDILEYNKKIYKCLYCNKIFSQKCNYIVHINRKNKCNIIKKEDNKLEDNKLEDNKLEDNKLEDNKLEDNKLEDNKLEDNNTNLLNIINDMKQKLIEQQDEINKLKNNNISNIKNINSNNNITNNITTNNTINYVNHDKEDLSKLIKDEIKEILNSGYSCIYKSIMYTHYNDRLPEFKNIRYSDTKSSYCDVYIDGDWKKVKFENTIDELINKHFYEVSDMYNDNKDLIESKFKEGLIKDYTSDYYKFISYEDEDKYPENWNKTMKRDQQKKMRRRLNHNKDEVKGLIINKSLVDKKSSLKTIK
jgi:hypothetical protein